MESCLKIGGEYRHGLGALLYKMGKISTLPRATTQNTTTTCQNVFFCTQALYCVVYGLGWPLVISWRIGFSGKGFHILNIVEL